MKKATEIDKQGLVYRALIRTKDVLISVFAIVAELIIE